MTLTGPPALVVDAMAALVEAYRRTGQEELLVDVVEAAQELVRTLIAAIEAFPLDDIDLGALPTIPDVDHIVSTVARLGELVASVREEFSGPR